MKLKKIIKIITGTLVFLTLPSLLFFGFLYFKYNEDLPTGVQGTEADALAYKMLDALNHEAYKNTNYIEWTFKRKHYYKWKKNKSTCDVYWKEYKVSLNLNDASQNQAFVHSFKVMDDDLSKELIEKARKYFNNDSFWLVAPYKIFDKGTERRLVTLENNKKALLVTYTSGGTTPGDSYLWHFDKNGKPTSFQMWVDILPIDGLTATWNDWVTTESGAQLPSFHEFGVFNLEISHIKGTK
ncbi:hypothetical protein EV196_106272 [Mariniflexile fucanivorans]|uniref:Uncharacterized protein n=1 Tax=Mariniflexile fucanivorans TaxID=264023 RepID=A0A4R1RGR3_9FLAO|nr:hypothetical protein [Mariniflexile fucanivorans]TCL65079.1 hypothetical protein EV196_106272 [Mariniflexile fucanivorans]